MAYPVTVIQTTIECGEVETTRQHIMHLVSAAVAKGARLIVIDHRASRRLRQ